MEWSTQHPCWTTRNRTQVQGGKRDPTHKRVIIWTRQQKGVSGLHMGKSIKSECVIQIHSRLQKHEQVLKFPTHINSAQSGSVTAHKWVDAAWGPAAVKGGEGGLSFHRSSGPGLLTELFHSPWDRQGVLCLPIWVLAAGNPHFSCFVCGSPQSAQQQAVSQSRGAVSCCPPDPSSLISAHRSPITDRENWVHAVPWEFLFLLAHVPALYVLSWHSVQVVKVL